MTYATMSQSPSGFFADGSARRTGSWSHQLRQTWAQHRAYRSLLAELRTLPDLQLEDIGLERATLKPFARAAINGA